MSVMDINRHKTHKIMSEITSMASGSNFLQIEIF